MLLAQDHYVQAVAKAHQEACDLNGRKWAKDERLRVLLKAPHLRRVPKRPKGGGSGGVGGVAEGLLAEITGGGGGGSVPMPLDPTVQVLLVVDRDKNDVVLSAGRSNAFGSSLLVSLSPRTRNSEAGSCPFRRACVRALLARRLLALLMS